MVKHPGEILMEQVLITNAISLRHAALLLELQKEAPADENGKSRYCRRPIRTLQPPLPLQRGHRRAQARQ